MLVSLLLLISAPAWGADVGNCLLCHRHRGLSTLDDDGNLKLFYINEDTFGNSVHAKVDCESCHDDIQEIPHDPAEKVDCLKECHIEEPSSETRFSHEGADEGLQMSVHSQVDAEGNPKEYAEDYPECKDCHDNPLYRPLSFFKHVRPGISQAAVARCKTCHKSDAFVFGYYNHVTTRLQKLRNPKNMAEVCARCHDDPALVERHELRARAVVTYDATYHGKAAAFLDESIPDCLDCHVVAGDVVHRILSHNDPESPTHDLNRGNICSQEECHPTASAKAAEYDVHAEFNPKQNIVRHYFTVFFHFLAGGTLLPLLAIMLLDMLRRHFPDAVFTTRKKKR